MNPPFISISGKQKKKNQVMDLGFTQYLRSSLKNLTSHHFKIVEDHYDHQKLYFTMMSLKLKACIIVPISKTNQYHFVS